MGIKNIYAVRSSAVLCCKEASQKFPALLFRSNLKKQQKNPIPLYEFFVPYIEGMNHH